MAHLHLSFLGPPLVGYGDKALAFPTRKALAVLAYLVVEGGWQPRQKLLSLLWPDSDEKRGRGALRITLLYLRQALAAAGGGDVYLHIQPDALGFNFNSDYILDLDAVETALTASDLPSGRRATIPEAVLDAYRGPFLDGFSLPDAPDFDDWITVQRQRFQRRLTLLFDRLTQQQMASRRFDRGIVAAGRWLVHDPLDETGHRRLMQLHALIGNRVAALQAYEAVRERLQADLGINPSAETEALARKIREEAQGGRPGEITPRRAAAPEPPLIPFAGRAAEHAQLVAIYRQAQQGHTQAIVIEGEPGIGKTRLAVEFRQWAALEGADWLEGRAFEAGGRLPYQPLAEALRARIEQENAPEDWLSDAWLAELSRLLPELRDRYPDLPPASSDPTTAGARLLEAIARLGAALAGDRQLARRRPGRPHTLVLFMDDIQWADTASRDALLYCLRAWAEKSLPVLLLLALRRENLAGDPALSGWLAHLARTLPVTSIRLGPITAADTTELVQALAEATVAARPLQAVSLTFAQWLYRETAGHPFFIGETLKALRSQSSGEGAAWMVAPGKGLVVPGVQQLILVRLNGLSAPARNLLAAAAVLGRPADFSRICQVAHLAEEAALPGLDELQRSGLLLETAASSHPYAINHDKIRQIVYSEAGEARRRLFHRRTLTALEAEQSPASELAHHALAARLPEAAFGYSLAAGDEAMSLFAVADAIKQYEQARTIGTGDQSPVPDLRQWQHLYTRLGRAYELAADFGRAEAVCQEMLALAQAGQETEMVCAALNRLASLAIYTHKLETAAAHLDQALAVAGRNNHKRWLAETEWSLAQLTHHRYDMVASRDHSARALALAREIESPELIAGALNNLAYAQMMLGELATAANLMAEARQGYAMLGNRALEADCLTALGGIRIFQGRSRIGLPLVEMALAIYRDIENAWGILFSSGWLAAGLLDRGEAEKALRISLESAGLAQELGTTPVSIWNRLWAGNAHRALCHFEAAVTAHREAAALNAATPLPAFAWYIAGELCADYVLMEDWEAAHGYARQALAHRQHPAIPQIVLPYGAITAALLRGGAADLAREDARQNDAHLSRLPRFRVAYLRSLALLAQEENDDAGAIAYLEEALSLAREMELAGEQKSILAALASLPGSADPISVVPGNGKSL